MNLPVVHKGASLQALHSAMLLEHRVRYRSPLNLEELELKDFFYASQGSRRVEGEPHNYHCLHSLKDRTECPRELLLSLLCLEVQ